MIPIRLIRVIDGDTIQVMCRGQKEIIRLHSVDTEESAIGYGKPATAAGIRAKHFTREMCQSGELSLELDYSPTGAIEQDLDRNRDRYNRIIAHIYIDAGDPEPLHLNAELIRLGLSPYFNKYGNSRVYDARMRQLQAEAQCIHAMIWNPESNTRGAFRNYDKLIPWWNDRAALIDLARADGRVLIPWECDNQWLSISKPFQPEDQKTPIVNLSGFSSFSTILDLQAGIQKNFTKGLVIHSKSSPKLLRFWLSDNSQINFYLLNQLIKEKTYGFVQGTLESYRGIPQFRVISVSRSPYF